MSVNNERKKKKKSQTQLFQTDIFRGKCWHTVLDTLLWLRFEVTAAPTGLRPASVLGHFLVPDYYYYYNAIVVV